MSKFGDRIAANRAAKDIGSIEVAEWGEDGVPLRIFYTAVTGLDIDKIQRKHKDFLSNPTIEAMVETIIVKAKDESGDKMFTLEDKIVLLNEPAELIARVFGGIFNAISVEEQEKN